MKQKQNIYHPEQGVTVTLNSINTKQLTKDLEVIELDTILLQKTVSDGIIFEAIGYKSEELILDPKEQQKRMLHLLAKIRIDLSDLRHKALIEGWNRELYLKSKVAYK